MFVPEEIPPENRDAFYTTLARQMELLMEDNLPRISNLANAAALIFHQLDDLNWAGFYLLRGRELVLGPFQGKPACSRITVGKGVCGTAAADKRSVIVPDVHEFPGHITCDPVSRSEMVIPLCCDGELFGVLDLDSPSPGRFDETDACGMETVLEKVAGVL
ncbi:MAG: GAF domain-containing protein [Bacillota bacterium]